MNDRDGNGLPSGEVTFVFTDIEGSTGRWERDPDGMRAALAAHAARTHAAVETHDGAIVKDTGDGTFAAFATPRSAVAAAVDLQRRLTATDWPGHEPLRVRIGVHTGPAEPHHGDYHAPAVNRCARVMAAAHGGQVLVSDDTVAALAGGDGLEFRDLGHHRLRDLERPLRLHQVLHPNLPDAFPPLRTFEGFPNNLPTVVSPLLGRDPEVAGLVEAVATDRLVTLTGAGGVGKTRLAVHLGAQVLEDHPDGVWLVELGTLQAPEFVGRAVASVLRLPDQPGHSTESALQAFVMDRDLLVILDNCEHLLESVAKLAEGLLRYAPDLRIVATSREPLGLRGERVFSVPPLSADGTGAAIELFLARAAAANRAFDPRTVDDEAVATICRRLDGLPLAIELAAARVRVMSVADISRRLDDRFRLLTGGSRTALPRQRTLEATVAWSYDLLPAPEQTLFQRLAVFAAPFRLEDAERVVTNDGLGGSLDETNVAEQVLELTERSLLVVERRGDSTRYRMLETIRAYGRERLAEAGESEALHRSHAEWADAGARDAARHLDGPQQTSWLEAVDATIDDLRAAMAWAEEADRHELGARIASSLYRYWYVRMVREGRDWLERFVVHVDALPTDVAARLLYTHGSLLQVMGHYRRSVEQLRESVRHYHQLDDPRGLAYAMHHLGRSLWGLAPQDEVMELFHGALRIFRDLDDPVGEGLTLLFVAVDEYLSEERLDAGIAVAGECEAIMRSVGAPQLVAHGAEIHAMALARKEGLPDAAPLMREAVSLYGIIDNPNCGAHCLENVALLLAGTEPGDAIALLAATERLREMTGVPAPPYENLSFEQARRQAETMLGQDAAGQAWRGGGALGFHDALRLADTTLAVASGAPSPH